jgi:hypothetical protein
VSTVSRRTASGPAAGEHLTSLPREHITNAVELLQAAQAGDTQPSTTPTRGGAPTARRSATSFQLPTPGSGLVT